MVAINLKMNDIDKPCTTPHNKQHLGKKQPLQKKNIRNSQLNLKKKKII